MTFHILTLFPELFETYFRASIFGRAQIKKLFSVHTYQIRTWSNDAHHKVDDHPYGGGAGMVMMVEPIHKGVTHIQTKIKKEEKRKKKKIKTRIILLSTRGKSFTQIEAKRLSKYDHLVFICGRYEGVDERVAKYIADEEISVGSYVLSGGEIPTMLIMDAVARHIPGVLGKQESLEDIQGSYPTYTRPEQYYPNKKKSRSWNVPKDLVEGNHKKIHAWREMYGKKI